MARGFFKKGHPNFNKGGYKVKDTSNMKGHSGVYQHKKGWKHSKETIKKLSLAKIGENNPAKRLDVRLKISLKSKGIKKTLEQRIKNSLGHKGEKHWNWKGGKCIASKKRYFDLDYKLWREAVFERDNYACQRCKISGSRCYLTAHHVKSWKNYPELRYEIDNGLTLCEECHKLTDNYKGHNKKDNL